MMRKKINYPYILSIPAIIIGFCFIFPGAILLSLRMDYKKKHLFDEFLDN